MGSGIAKSKKPETEVVKERDLEQFYKDELMKGSEANEKFVFDRALVVDDSLFNRKMLKKTIQDFFKDIQQAEDGVDAVQMVGDSIKNNQPYDIIFMDSIMTTMGGIEATAKIRQLGFTNMIIAVTGTILDDEVNQFQQAGAQDVMLKPLLMSHVESILSGNTLLLLLLLFCMYHSNTFLCRFKTV
jgi:CheY-like chemotaxis protein